MQKLNLNGALPAQRFTVIVGGVSFRVRVAWNVRKQAWYLNIFPVNEGESAGIAGVRLEEGGIVGAGGEGVRVGFGGFIWCKQLNSDGGELWFVSEAEAADLRAASAPTVPTLRFTGV